MKKGRFKGKKKNQYPKERRNVEDGYIPPAFIEYYHEQFVPLRLSEDEFQNMIETFKMPLDHTFRIVGGSNDSQLRQKLINDISNLCTMIQASINSQNANQSESNQNSESTSQNQTEQSTETKTTGNTKVNIEKITCLNDMFGDIYRLSADKSTLRRNPALAPLRQWLNVNMNIGNVVRQELVSMVPPYFLDLERNSRVLDVAAAPGSKTSQIMGYVHDGLLVANDVNLTRCTTLVHNMGRLRNLNNEQSIVISHPAQYLPLYEYMNGSKEVVLQKFDRVLCDVPCSGDGTLRKNPDASLKYSIENGAELHPIQRAILIRGLRHLKAGGTLVYSTCSLNPIEDEAVINSVLVECKETVKIKDVSSMFPELKRSPGMPQWKVLSESKLPTMYFNYTPENDSKPKDEVTRAIDGIEHCMRFFPQLNDTGGFFVAVLTKISDDFDTIVQEPRLPHKPSFKWNEHPYLPLKNVSPTRCQLLTKNFGLTDEFVSNLFVRDDQEDMIRNIYYATQPVNEIVQSVDPALLRAVSCGVRVFTWKESLKDQNTVRAVPCIEGAALLGRTIPPTNDRYIKVSVDDMKKLLLAGNDGVLLSDLTTHDQFTNLKIGGLLFTLDIEGTGIYYGGLLMKEKIILYVKKEVIDQEIQRIDIELDSLKYIKQK